MLQYHSLWCSRLLNWLDICRLLSNKPINQRVWNHRSGIFGIAWRREIPGHKTLQHILFWCIGKGKHTIFSNRDSCLFSKRQNILWKGKRFFSMGEILFVFKYKKYILWEWQILFLNGTIDICWAKRSVNWHWDLGN